MNVDGATVQKTLTAEGTIVGTFQYMSPEQLEGQDVDQRTDIFALGAVLYEMATGRRAFEGKTRTSLIAAIVAAEPKSMSELQPLTPASFEQLVRACLAKDPEERIQSAHDVKLQLQWIANGTDANAASARPARRTLIPWLAALVVTALLAGGGVALWQRMHAKRPLLTRFSISGIQIPIFSLGGIAVSPDGRTIVWCGGGMPVISLYMRNLDGDQAVPIEGTQGATRPFFSTDGQWIAFASDGVLRKVLRNGGALQIVAPFEGVYMGGTWLRDGTIVLHRPKASTAFALTGPAAGS
jgi:hypothetical protein